MDPKDKPIFDALNDTEAGILTAYGEARGEPMEGKQGVVVVITNRAAQWKKSIKEICFAPNQFSCFLSADPNYPKLLHIAGSFGPTLKIDKALKECFDAWYNDSWEVAVKLAGATFYRVTGCKNAWFDRQVDKGKLIRTASIGAHEFFKEA